MKTLLLLASLLALVATPAAASLYTVDRQDDSASATGCADATPNDCSLRGAILKANTHGGPDEIALHAGTYTLTLVGAAEDAGATGDLDIASDLTITGDGSATTIIDAAGLKDGVHFPDRAIHIDPAGSGALTVSISGVTVRNAETAVMAFVLASGAGILNGRAATGPTDTVGSAVMLTDVAVRDNTSGRDGGGIANFGAMAIVESVVDHNTASQAGAGIFQGDAGSVEVVDSTVSNNTVSSGSGGGLYVGSFSVDPNVPAVSVLRSTFNDNHAHDGGGVFQNRGKVAIVSSTISHNTSTSGGLSAGGVVSNGAVTLFSSTITLNDGNGGPGGISGSAAAENTIIAGNGAGSASDCVGTLTSFGYDLIENATGCTIVGDTTTNKIGASARLAPLAHNGGPTKTHALLSTSPAIDAGDPAGCLDDDNLVLAIDQRGEPRTLDGDADGTARCDIGAVEHTTCTGKPAKPILLTPTDGAKLKSVHVELDWSDVECAQRYKLQVRRDSSRGALVIHKQRTLDTELATDALLPGVTYFWRVRACNTAKCGKSAFQAFTLRATAK